MRSIDITRRFKAITWHLPDRGRERNIGRKIRQRERDVVRERERERESERARERERERERERHRQIERWELGFFFFRKLPVSWRVAPKFYPSNTRQKQNFTRQNQ